MRAIDRPTRKKLILTAVLVAALAACLVGPLRGALFERHVFAAADESAQEVVDEAFGRALTAFALARATNAVVSVIQETEVHASPAGVGVTFAVGETLDPLNDLVERFSWVMLVALTSLGIQKILIEIAPWVSVQLLATLALMLWLAGLWLGEQLKVDLSVFARRLLLLAVVIRFAVPAAAGLNQLAYENFLASRYDQAAAAVERQTEELKQADPTTDLSESRQETSEGWWQRLRDSLSRAEEAIDLRRMTGWLKEKASTLIEGFLALMVVFLLNTVLLPIAFLWGLFRLCRALAPDLRLSRTEAELRRKIAGKKNS